MSCATACEARLELGGRCVSAAECPTPYVCLYGRCRSACVVTRDCPLGADCILNAAGVGVCALPEQDRCATEVDCDDELVCASERCRQGCESVRCAPGSTCIEDGSVLVCHAIETLPCVSVNHHDHSLPFGSVAIGVTPEPRPRWVVAGNYYDTSRDLWEIEARTFSFGSAPPYLDHDGTVTLTSFPGAGWSADAPLFVLPGAPRDIALVLTVLADGPTGWHLPRDLVASPFVPRPVPLVLEMLAAGVLPDGRSIVLSEGGAAIRGLVDAIDWPTGLLEAASGSLSVGAAGVAVGRAPRVGFGDLCEISLVGLDGIAGAPVSIASMGPPGTRCVRIATAWASDGTLWALTRNEEPTAAVHIAAQRFSPALAPLGGAVVATPATPHGDDIALVALLDGSVRAVWLALEGAETAIVRADGTMGMTRSLGTVAPGTTSFLAATTAAGRTAVAWSAADDGLVMSILCDD